MKLYDAIQLTDELDAADAANAPVQSEEYNRIYREWRCRTGNRYSFSGKLKQNMYTYVDGMGMQDNSAKRREYLALSNTIMLMLGVVLIFALVENVLVMPLLFLFKMMGVEVSYSFNDSIAYGNQYAVLCVLLFESILKYLLPMLLVHFQVKMPLPAAYPMKVRDTWYLGTTMSALCVGFFCTSFLSLFFPMEIFNVQNIGMTYEVISYMDGWCRMVYLLVELVGVPILAELLFHGMLFQTLRQFGVSYAIVVIAFMNTTMMHDPVSFATIFMTSIVAGYGVWQSGSVLTGILVHMVSHVMGFVFSQSDLLPSVGIMMSHVWFIFLVLGIGLMGCWTLHYFGGHKWTLHDYATFIPVKEKAKIIIYSSPMLAAWFLCFLLMMVEIFM